MSSPKTLKLATFNIRFGGPQDPVDGSKEQRKSNFGEERPWYERRDRLVDQVIWEEPDIIGFQEVRFVSQLFATDLVIIFIL
jgi:hypothetical protein